MSIMEQSRANVGWSNASVAAKANRSVLTTSAWCLSTCLAVRAFIMLVAGTNLSEKLTDSALASC